MRLFEMNNTLISGVFIRELKNRFLCEVEVAGHVALCYVPSSCHLSNFLNLRGCQVLLKRVESNNARTEFAVFAIPYKRNYIILNTSEANHVFEREINSRRFSYLGDRKKLYRERVVSGYKSDFFIEDSNTIVEIKSVISTEQEAPFPTVFSERTQTQLILIQNLLKEKYNVLFCIVSLSPYVNSIRIIKETPFYIEFIKCIEAGMHVEGYRCRLVNGMVHIDKHIHVDW